MGGYAKDQNARAMVSHGGADLFCPTVSRDKSTSLAGRRCVLIELPRNLFALHNRCVTHVSCLGFVHQLPREKPPLLGKPFDFVSIFIADVRAVNQSQLAAGPHRSTSLLDSPRHPAHSLGRQHRLLVQPLCAVHHLQNKKKGGTNKGRYAGTL